MSCLLLVPDGQGRCVWCRKDDETHLLIPCPRCGGHPFLPDPTDRTPGPVWLRRKVRCPCTAAGGWGGWLVRETGEVADDETLRAAGVKPWSPWEDPRTYDANH